MAKKEKIEKMSTVTTSKTPPGVSKLNLIGVGFFSCTAVAISILFLFKAEPAIRLLETVGFTLSLVGLLISVFLRWVSVEESTVASIMRQGKLQRIYLVKKDWYLDDDYELEFDEDGLHPPTTLNSVRLAELLGGLKFYIWLLEYVHTYSWDWLKSMPNGDIVPRHADDEYLTRVGYDYPFGMVMTEGIITSDNYPVEVTLILTAQLTNPYKALFNVKWFEQLMNGVRPYVKDYVNANTYDYIRVQAAKTTEQDELYKNLLARKVEKIGAQEKNIIEILKENYGVFLRRIGFSKVVLKPEHEELALQQKRGEMEALRESASRVGSTTKPFIAMLAEELGATTPQGLLDTEKLAKIRNEYNQDPTAFELKYAAAIKRSKEFIERQIDSDTPGALKSFHFSGGSSGMNLIALLGESLGKAIGESLRGIASGTGGVKNPSETTNGGSEGDSKRPGESDANWLKRKKKG